MQITKLPFDMFQRYMIVKEIIDCIKKKEPASILDVGGHPGTISKFFPANETFIIDLKVCKKVTSAHTHSIKADCEYLPFKDRCFDFVTNLDVLEHISKSKRTPTIEEMLRVSNRFVILAAPFDSKKVRNADKTVYDLIHNIHKREDGNLKEHIAYGLPNLREIRRFLDSKKGTYLEFPNGYLENWLFMQMLNARFSIASEEIYYNINQLYNIVLYSHDNRKPSYRRTILVDKLTRRSSELLNSLKDMKKKEGASFSSKTSELINVVQCTLENLESELRLKNDHKLRLKDDHIRNLGEKIGVLETELRLKDDHIRNLDEKIGVLEAIRNNTHAVKRLVKRDRD